MPSWLPWVLVPLLAVALITMVGLIFSDDTNTDPLDPKNPTENGTMALAAVLAERGAAVERVSRHEDLIDAQPSKADTVVITSTSDLDDGVARAIVDSLRRADRVVIVIDDHQRLADLRVPVQVTGGLLGEELTAGGAGEVVPPDARTADLDRTFDSAEPGWSSCFRAESGSGLMYGPYGAATAVVIGSTYFATNDQILRADNAQLATWLYGASSRLIWYQPDPYDTVNDGDDDDSDETSIAPPWFGPILGLLSVAVIILMIAAGRRFGPLSREPLPVIVSALETTRTRGRLYRGAGDLQHSAAVLRSAAVRRLAGRFGQSSTGPIGEVAERVASVVASSHPRARELLLGPLPDTTEAGVRWLHELRELEATATHEGVVHE
jgi:hypothetical protein